MVWPTTIVREAMGPATSIRPTRQCPFDLTLPLRRHFPHLLFRGAVWRVRRADVIKDPDARFILQQLLAHATWATVTARALERRVSLRHRAFANWWNAGSAAWRAAEAQKSTAPDGAHE